MLLLQIPLRGAITTGIGGSEQHRDRRATRPDVYRVMGPAQLSADSAKDSAKRDRLEEALEETSINSESNQSLFPTKTIQDL